MTDTQSIEINLLQIPRVQVDGAEVTFPLRRAEALLYYMACKRLATRKELVDLIWETCDAELGHKNLRNAMYVLKKALGAEVLLTPRKTTILLNPDLSIVCDYTRFMEEEDFHAYRGQFLSGFHIKGADSFDQWVERAREKVREEYLAYLSRLIQGASQKGAVARAVHYALDYLREEPSDEKMSLFLMELYRSAGSYQKAAEAYANLREYLKEELGIVPLAETTRAYYEMLNEWNLTAADATRWSGVLFPSRARLYDAIKSTLHQFDKEGGNAGRHLHLSGEAGAGKTFLLEGALGSVAFKNTKLTRGKCFETETGRPYHAWQPVLMDAVEFAKEGEIALSGKVLRRLAGAFPPLEGYLADSYSDGCAAPGSILDDFVYIFHLILRRQRMVVILENIQWMDAPGAALLDALARRFHTGQLLLITLGQDFLPTHMRDYLRLAESDRLLGQEQIPGLSLDDVSMLIQEQCGSEAARLTAAQILKETAGNLSLISSVLHPRPADEIADTLLARSRDLLAKRVEQLSAGGRALLEMLSFFPGGAPCRILAALCEMERKDLSAACGELKRRGFVKEVDQGDQTLLTFLHQNTRERIYLGHPALERLAIHERIARLLRQQPAPPTGEVYVQVEYHLTQSGNGPAAILCKADRLAMFASDCFRSLPALQGAEPGLKQSLSAHHLELETALTALGQMAPLSDSLEACHARLTLLNTAMTLLSGSEAQALKMAVSIVSCCDDAAIFLLVHYFCEYERQTIHPDRSGLPGVIRRARQKYDGQSRVCIFLHWLEGRLHAQNGEYEQAAACLQSGLKLAGQSGLVKAGILHAQGVLLLRQKRYGQAHSALTKAIDSLGDAEPCAGMSFIYLDCSLAESFRGDREAARQMAHTAASLAVKGADATGLVAAYARLAVLSANNQPEALGFLQKAAELADQASSPHEHGLVCYAKAALRHSLDGAVDAGGRLAGELNQPLSVYCRKGLMLLSTVKDTIEQEELRGLLALPH
ncbi:MAG: AAA family ATPase [Oscillospiraceae bacterium]|nr:AAA family ATPase [Oscillospiraceae bacterium]